MLDPYHPFHQDCSNCCYSYNSLVVAGHSVCICKCSLGRTKTCIYKDRTCSDHYKDQYYYCLQNIPLSSPDFTIPSHFYSLYSKSYLLNRFLLVCFLLAKVNGFLPTSLNIASSTTLICYPVPSSIASRLETILSLLYKGSL